MLLIVLKWQRPNSFKHGSSPSNLGDDNNMITIHADLVDVLMILQQMPGLTPESSNLAVKRSSKVFISPRQKAVLVVTSIPSPEVPREIKLRYCQLYSCTKKASKVFSTEACRCASCMDRAPWTSERSRLGLMEKKAMPTKAAPKLWSI